MRAATIALAAISVGLMASTASAVTIPGIPSPPSLPTVEPDDIARFSVTVDGMQDDDETFARVPEADGCSLQTQGKLSERWMYARGKGVTMEFRKYGKRIYIQRAKRPLGDAAFATKGTVRREASGDFYIKSGTACVSFPNADPICGQELKAPLDLALGYSSGKLSLRESGPARAVPNPAELCGIFPAGGTSFNQLTSPYPFMNKQKGTLTAKKIFKSRKGFEVDLSDTFIEPADNQGFTTFSETLRGHSTVTFKRL